MNEHNFHEIIEDNLNMMRKQLIEETKTKSKHTEDKKAALTLCGEYFRFSDGELVEYTNHNILKPQAE